jgi:signal transduction histidine kinase
VFLVLAGLSVGTGIALRGVVHNQEQRLLGERVAELAAYLTSATTQSTSALVGAGQAVALDGAHDAMFPALATPLTQRGATMSVVQRTGAGYRVVASVRGRTALGTSIGKRETRLLDRASGTSGLVYDVFQNGSRRVYAEAVDVPGAKVPTIAVLEGPLPKARPIPTTKDSPYRELDVVLYAGTRVDPSRIVLISGAVPKPSSDPAHVLVPIGTDKILLVAAGHTALVGRFAQTVPWIMLLSGVLLALLVAVLVEVLTRRREYALNLVEQRTRAMYQAQIAAEAARADQERMLVLSDRHRIARDLHDQVIQRLFAMGLRLQQLASRLEPGPLADRLDEQVGDLDDTINEIRSTIFGLRRRSNPSALDAELRRLAADLSEVLGVVPQVTLDERLDEVPGEVAEDLVAAAREALTNVARHARAEHVEMSVAVEDEDVVLEVIDDGVGIGTAARRSGLTNLCERAARHDGSCAIGTTAGGGTQLVWTVPIAVQPQSSTRVMATGR